LGRNEYFFFCEGYTPKLQNFIYQVLSEILQNQIVVVVAAVEEEGGGGGGGGGREGGGGGGGLFGCNND